METNNPNKFYPDDKGWIEKISEDWQQHFTDFIKRCKTENLDPKQVLKIARKVADHKKDEGIYEEVKSRLGL